MQVQVSGFWTALRAHTITARRIVYVCSKFQRSLSLTCEVKRQRRDDGECAHHRRARCVAVVATIILWLVVARVKGYDTSIDIVLQRLYGGNKDSYFDRFFSLDQGLFKLILS